MSSRDGIHWDRRFLESFIPPGLDSRNWPQRTNTPARGIVPTSEDEISLYVERHRAAPGNHLQRLVLRTDGFVSVQSGYSGGEMVTKPLIFQGDNLILNFATSAAGSIRLEIQDANGNPLPGFALVPCHTCSVGFVASATASRARNDDDAMFFIVEEERQRHRPVPSPPTGQTGVADDLCVGRRRRWPSIVFLLPP